MKQEEKQPVLVEQDPEILESETQQKRFFQKAKRWSRKLPFVRHLVAMWFALRDHNTPVTTKAVLAGAVLYFLLPVDLVPDFLAIVGFTDDAAVVLAALKAAKGAVQPRHYEQADRALG